MTFEAFDKNGKRNPNLISFDNAVSYLEQEFKGFDENWYVINAFRCMFEQEKNGDSFEDCVETVMIEQK
ncbi:hypothetical protein UFOVP459_46 [uncultured Caudovirales phage]|jgi:hypothetical protein|uniref:Uncharacterized protein n=1 Tax=uncultured Caudovirales phage TaxID=2100421 RepID=A0A6J5SGH4_9CAUD|nr:hypothetical protein UFOVP459_46 [uncultured Caudovirales phage]CAB4183122.1 hypothetical protein UFOVP1089_39 [uncultured Caudovirales phage]CAB4213034.1 hypothetical protein UFOVP1443_58 [uncultured Caudovirales phage]